MTDVTDPPIAPTDAPAAAVTPEVVAPVEAPVAETPVEAPAIDWQTAFWDRIAADAAVSQAK